MEENRAVSSFRGNLITSRDETREKAKGAVKSCTSGCKKRRLGFTKRKHNGIGGTEASFLSLPGIPKARTPFAGTVQYFLTAPALATSAPRGQALDSREPELETRRGKRRRRRTEKGSIDSPSSILIRLPVNRADVNTVHLIGTTGRLVCPPPPLDHLVIHERHEMVSMPWVYIDAATLAASP